MHRAAGDSNIRVATSNRGFSLVELIVVMVLISIAAAVATAAMGSVGTTRQKSAARQLARDLTFARAQAILAGRTVWVVFDPAAETYSLLMEAVDSGGRGSAVALIDPATGRPLRQALASLGHEGVTLNALSLEGGSEVGFDWRGRPKLDDSSYLSSPGLITLSGAAVSIQPNTGFASWQ
jgi:type II secretion system protein H